MSSADTEVALELNQYLHGDAFELLPQIPDGSVDLLLTDPPYGIDYQSNRRIVMPKLPKIAGDVDLSWLPDFVKEAYRVLKNNRHFYCFCRWDTYPIFKTIIERRFQVKNALIWVKNNHGSGDLTGAYAPKYEMMIFACKGRRKLNDKRESDILQCPTVSSKARRHPTQKPLDLLEFLIRKSTKKGEIVLDPFAGVGSTAKAARRIGRQYLAYEISEHFHQEGVEFLESI